MHLKSTRTSRQVIKRGTESLPVTWTPVFLKVTPESRGRHSAYVKSPISVLTILRKAQNFPKGPQQEPGGVALLEFLWGLMGLPSRWFYNLHARKSGAPVTASTFQGMSKPSRKHKSPICQSGLFLLPLECSMPFPHLPFSLVWGQGQSCLLGRRRLQGPSPAWGGGRWTPRLLALGAPSTRPPYSGPTQLPHARSLLPCRPTKAEGGWRTSLPEFRLHSNSCSLKSLPGPPNGEWEIFLPGNAVPTGTQLPRLTVQSSFWSGLFFSRSGW